MAVPMRSHHCGREWQSSHRTAGWFEHSCVRPVDHKGKCVCGCGAQPDSGTAPGTGDEAPDQDVTTSDEGTS